MSGSINDDVDVQSNCGVCVVLGSVYKVGHTNGTYKDTREGQEADGEDVLGPGWVVQDGQTQNW